MEKSFEAMLKQYADHHTLTITKFTHAIGVPLIIIALQIFLNLFHDVLTSTLIILLILYYAKFDIILASLTGISLFLLNSIAQLIIHYQLASTSFIISIFLFILGWTIQFIGHHFEKTPPAFLSNKWQMLIAPIFLCAEFCFLLGYRSDLKRKIE